MENCKIVAFFYNPHRQAKMCEKSTKKPIFAKKLLFFGFQAASFYIHSEYATSGTETFADNNIKSPLHPARDVSAE